MNIKICTAWLMVIFSLGCAPKNSDRVVQPVEENGLYLIKVHNCVMEVDPKIGGRITSLRLNENEFLTGKDINDFNWGSTFWPSPQSKWNWPPPAEIDNKPYSASVVDGVLKMTSPKDPDTGWVVTKEFYGDRRTGSFVLRYTITNRSGTAKRVAPWEVTRVRTDGLAFFPMGEGDLRGGLIPLTIKKNGIVWFRYQREKIPTESDRQLYADGSEGWIAEVNDHFILVKKFPDVPFEKIAPMEGDIELYASPPDSIPGYVEIENQGAYELLQPEASSHWEVRWYLRKLPDDLKVEVGNRELISYVRALFR